jgi:DNA-binding response OmpR family regulator
VQLLLIERDKNLVRELRRPLEKHGMTVDAAWDGEEGDRKARTRAYDAIILDLLLPKIDGLSLLQQWRESGLSTRVLILTSSDSVADKVRGLDLGADDCLTKPVHHGELVARLRALLRRSHYVPGAVMRIHDLEIDTSSRSVKRAGRPIHLTPREFAILQFLASHCGKVVSRSLILKYLYDDLDANTSNIVNVYIRYLRSKIDRGHEPPLILTRRGHGYLLRGDN